MPDPGPGGRLLSPAVMNRRIDDAGEAVRMGARGRSRAETRALLVAELRARGIMPPPPTVDLLVDYVAGGPAQRVAFQAKPGGFALRFLSAAIRHRPLPAWDVTATRPVPSSLPVRPVEVILSGDARQHLAVGDDDIFEVWFAPATPESAPGHAEAQGEDAADHLVAVFRGEHQVGVLDPDASAAWRPLLQESREVSQTLATFAARKQAETGEWRLLVGLPMP
jgi:hypothetical protein